MLFLACHNLRSPLVTAVGSPHIKILDFHVNDANPAVIARHILLLKVVSDGNFNPENEEDIGYVWNVWYDAAWPQSTLDRFIEDIKSLLNEALPENLTIPDMNQRKAVRGIWIKWLSNAKISAIADFMDLRYQMNHIFKNELNPNYMVPYQGQLYCGMQVKAVGRSVNWLRLLWRDG